MGIETYSAKSGSVTPAEIKRGNIRIVENNHLRDRTSDERNRKWNPHLLVVKRSHDTCAEYPDSLRIDQRAGVFVNCEPSDQLYPHVALVWPFGRILRVVGRVCLIWARSGDRELSAREVALVRELKHRALGAGKVRELGGGEFDQLRFRRGARFGTRRGNARSDDQTG